MDLFDGSHYDQYVYTWSSYKPGPVKADVFTPPDICKDATVRRGQRHSLTYQAISMLPAVHVGPTAGAYT